MTRVSNSNGVNSNVAFDMSAKEAGEFQTPTE